MTLYSGGHAVSFLESCFRLHPDLRYPQKSRRGFRIRPGRIISTEGLGPPPVPTSVWMPGWRDCPSLSRRGDCGREILSRIPQAMCLRRADTCKYMLRAIGPSLHRDAIYFTYAVQACRPAAWFRVGGPAQHLRNNSISMQTRTDCAQHIFASICACPVKGHARGT